ncbi:MAG: Uma2 family endonuclease [Planctomycetales bacterium]|nr:Uma2 family endonuclease [Planctomycetales bacterium]
MSTVERVVHLDGEQRTLIRDVSYGFYKQFCDAIGEQSIRLSFIDGMLEIMVTKNPHEFYKTVLAKLIEATVLEGNIPVRSGGNMTFQRDDLEKGFEPDECWWIAHEAQVRGRSEFDFKIDPAPDLAVEIEMSRSLVNRISIYAAIGVAEIWRFDGNNLQFCQLQPDGSYQDCSSSLSFPFLSPADLLPYLAIGDDRDETTRIRQYIQWLREQGHSV